MTGFDLSSVFSTVADAIPEHTLLVWRNRHYTYGEINTRADGVAQYLTSRGLGCHTERKDLQGHQSGQDHLGIYLRNGNQYLESMIAEFRARVAPFNVSYRYVEDELVDLLENADARLVYAAEFAPKVAAIRDRLPRLQVLIQVGDHTGNPLLPGALDYESLTTTASPASGMPTPSPDDLYILYTGGTTGMPKGVLWRQHDIFLSSMGGRPFGSQYPLASYAELAAQASQTTGARSVLMLPPVHARRRPMGELPCHHHGWPHRDPRRRRTPAPRPSAAAGRTRKSSEHSRGRGCDRPALTRRNRNGHL